MSYPPEERQILDQAVAILHQHFGESLSRVVLFGSRARRDHQETSDFDLLVVFNRKVESLIDSKAIFDIIYPLCWEKNVVVACHPVSEEQYAAEKSPLLMNVRKEGVAL